MPPGRQSSQLAARTLHLAIRNTSRLDAAAVAVVVVVVVVAVMTDGDKKKLKKVVLLGVLGVEFNLICLGFFYLIEGLFSQSHASPRIALSANPG